MTLSVTIVGIVSDMAKQVSIDLTGPDATALRKPMRGQGGFQSLLRTLQQQWDGRQLDLSAVDLERVRRYSAA